MGEVVDSNKNAGGLLTEVITGAILEVITTVFAEVITMVTTDVIAVIIIADNLNEDRMIKWVS